VDDHCSSYAKKLAKMIDFFNKEFEITISGAKVYMGLHIHKKQDLKLIYLN
jgi:hypothetical protein